MQHLRSRVTVNLNNGAQRAVGIHRSCLGRQQAGASKIGILLLIGFMVSFILGGLKLAPLYVDHNLVTGICADLIESGEAADMSITELRQEVSKGLRINNIRDFDLTDITLRRVNGKPVINIAYERRVAFVANLDVVAKFSTELQ